MILDRYLRFLHFDNDSGASEVTRLPCLQLLDLIYGLLKCKPCSTAQFSGSWMVSAQVDTAETDLRRVLRGAASCFWHAGWKHKHWVEYPQPSLLEKLR